MVRAKVFLNDFIVRMDKIWTRAVKYGADTAIIVGDESYSYQKLVDSASKFASILLKGKSDLSESRIAFMVNPGFDYVRVQWGIWQAGGIAVPICLSYPIPSIRYIIEDTKADTIVASREYIEILEEYAKQNSIRLIDVSESFQVSETNLPFIDSSRGAMILYTSGTTNLPKGVVTTHKNIQAQITSLVNAWAWSKNDHILCTLPLHHVHGIINVVSCALWSGAICEFLPKFSPENVFELFKNGRINVYMAVPTIYYKLITYWEKLSIEEQEVLYDILKKFRLMVSGSAALPVTTLEKWQTISGHTLLERYGMTEIGMAISNPYYQTRLPGHIGFPLDGVEVKLVDEVYNPISPGESGEIIVRGQNVFTRYWNKPEATKEAFTDEGWFKTGDVAIIENGYYKILGRMSVDIIKSGGYKISALEIEDVLRGHSQIADCCVVGIDDDEWGELVVVAIVPKEDPVDVEAIEEWIKKELPSYKIPRKFKILKELPRNAMGKVTKTDVKLLFTIDS